jgi:hypothetical protein
MMMHIILQAETAENYKLSQGIVYDDTVTVPYKMQTSVIIIFFEDSCLLGCCTM